MKKLLYPIIILLFATSCGKLSRGKAKDEIIKAYNLPKVETVELPIKYRVPDNSMLNNPDDIKENYTPDNETKLKTLESAGYIKLIETEEYIQIFNNTFSIKVMNVELSDKGKKECTPEGAIKYCDLEFGEITGMVEIKGFMGVDGFQVNYTLVHKNVSEFGKLVNEIKRSYDPNIMSFNKRANFIKYDDGYRLEK